ncbi:MAG: CBS domain-containing protein [Candidatus Rokubacteria bacterium]|nr:CBS domain-containing protein [Candidatus Rokubacteria bacterium]
MRVKEWMSASPTTVPPKTPVPEARELTKLTVGEVMTKAVITVDPERPIEDAASLMLEHRIGALPVVNNDRLAGIITETDLLRAFVHSRGSTPTGAGRG